MEKTNNNKQEVQRGCFPKTDSLHYSTNQKKWETRHVMVVLVNFMYN